MLSHFVNITVCFSNIFSNQFLPLCFGNVYLNSEGRFYFMDLLESIIEPEYQNNERYDQIFNNLAQAFRDSEMFISNSQGKVQLTFDEEGRSQERFKPQQSLKVFIEVKDFEKLIQVFQECYLRLYEDSFNIIDLKSRPSVWKMNRDNDFYKFFHRGV